MDLFRYEHVRVADIVSADLALPEGVTVLTGPSGSGKTTLLRLLCAMQVPTAGTVRYRGEDVSTMDPPTLRSRVTMVTQTPVVWEGTIGANLDAARLFQGRPPSEPDRLREALGWVGLHKGPEEDAAPLSGGERQRVALARVMLASPDVLLLDEPTAALDVAGARDLVVGVLARIRAAGSHVVMVTHDPGLLDVADLVVTVADHVALVGPGQDRQVGR